VLRPGNLAGFRVRSAVLVALMSYDPSVSYSTAESLLVSTASMGTSTPLRRLTRGPFWDRCCRQREHSGGRPADGSLDAERNDGGTGVSVTEAHWAHGKLTLVVSSLATGDRLAVQLDYAHAKSRHVSTRTLRSVFRTAKPSLVLLRVYAAKKQIQGPIKAHVT